MDPEEGAFTSEIRMFSFDFCPPNWLPCDGRPVNVSDYPQLFLAIGNTYGITPSPEQFLLPDLRGRAVMGHGQGPGLTPRRLGQASGQNEVTLTSGQLPTHTHAMTVGAGAYTDLVAAPGGTTRPSRVLTSLSSGATDVAENYYVGPIAPNTTLSPAAISNVGAGQPHTNLQPLMALTFAICVNGDYVPPMT